jgi:hypothetical protein
MLLLFPERKPILIPHANLTAFCAKKILLKLAALYIFLNHFLGVLLVFEL